MPVGQLGIGALPDSSGKGQATTISCSSNGNCVAGGTHAQPDDDNDAFGYGFLAAESGGRWGKAFLVPGLDSLDVGRDEGVTWVSCVRPGFCSAGGYYEDDSAAWCVSCHYDAFVVNDVHGVWFRAIPVPGLAKLNNRDLASLDIGTCIATGNCRIVGSYMDARVAGSFTAIRKLTAYSSRRRLSRTFNYSTLRVTQSSQL